MLHGWGGSFESTFVNSGWNEALHEAARETAGINLPGHGGGGSDDPADYAHLGEAVEKRLPPGAMDIVGYSLGGKIALAIALRNHVRIRRLVIGGVGDNLFAPEPAGDLVAQALVDGVTPQTPAPIAALVEYSRQSGSAPAALAAVLRRPPNPVIREDDLGRLACPTLLVKGDKDMLATPWERLAKALPHAAKLNLPGIDHLRLPTCPEFRSAAIAFLAASDDEVTDAKWSSKR